MLLAVTGVTGFLGRALAAAAAGAGHVVRGLVAGYPARVPAGVEPVVGSLADAGALRRLVAGAEVLVHLAAVGVQDRDRDDERMRVVNAVQPLALLSAAKEAGVARAVLVGTCLEYGGHGRLPAAPVAGAPRCTEESPTDAPDPYGATKAEGGAALRARAEALELPAWYLRVATLYGPGDEPSKLLPGAVAAAAARRPLEMHAGEQVREWLHVDDAAAALLAAAAAPPPGPVVTLNVGTGEGISLRELVSRVFALAGADAALVRAGARPYRAGEVHRLVMDVSRAKAALPGWAPRIALEDGLARLVDAARAAGATGP